MMYDAIVSRRTLNTDQSSRTRTAHAECGKAVSSPTAIERDWFLLINIQPIILNHSAKRLAASSGLNVGDAGISFTVSN